MKEKIIRVVEAVEVKGLSMEIVETEYEFGRHYVFVVNGMPGFHSLDLERVRNYMYSSMPIKR